MRPLCQVHEATLIDLVYPTEIVGKRVRYRLDGSKLLKARGAFQAGPLCSLFASCGSSKWDLGVVSGPCKPVSCVVF